ncbi:aminopeptidase [Aneurinibacillus aneurinilyticus]|uniref:Aminopeptidase II n=1 Tax=Aneurinibacillus aneurinilyticus ATCC 12856 TaxID=649747 RepID=U1XAX0_ANEAE|nr:aminopeptidase [Aneurinibacillus aneurinilyticus]ERI11688.1 aminopeptidase II [Aneurinibacillus aneurinilyticus ATCC 12856]MED0708852.1 aminopeptidase [Aneurinibacillus aneurinilyticus]MED0725356.1 aminopeptidase [Aneurinibacillus aneurinilyticus]MED0731546.1 aminopeptidase [Aneurinibacillus aneurinilyticus]MED0741101.1 aminopeptidase [Aneurinibacillus aneurinilyticus]
MPTFEQKLDKYAELAVKVGVNVQPGQTLVLQTPITAADFARKIVKNAYEAGAKNVHIEWNDEVSTRIKYDLAPDEAFTQFPLWRAKGFEEMAEEGACFLSIVSTNPELLKGVDPNRVSAAAKASGKAMETFRRYISSDKVSWSIVAVPSKEWAAKVFPEKTEEEQVPALWEAIFNAVRVNVENPVQAWKEHNASLDQKVEYLNQKKYKYLHYQAPGTDLTIELPSNHLWVGGGSTSERNVPFVANIPTEEVFTVPLKEGVNGVVTSTKPLNYGGNLIENFSLTFEKGRVVDFQAETGYDTLKQLIETDEGSHYLGEVALVPHNSPISNANIIFYNTLFDENASNHIAIGSSYAFCIEGGKKMSKEELEQNGLNTSITHVDFMIGSADMNIDGETESGTREPIFRNGNWI